MRSVVGRERSRPGPGRVRGAVGAAAPAQPARISQSRRAGCAWLCWLLLRVHMSSCVRVDVVACVMVLGVQRLLSCVRLLPCTVAVVRVVVVGCVGVVVGRAGGGWVEVALAAKIACNLVVYSGAGLLLKDRGVHACHG